MEPGFPDHFSAAAAGYAAYRPSYPSELFDWLASVSPGLGLAWDAATGNGQAALGLARRFERVIATDASADQIAHAWTHPRVEYRVGRAEEPGLGPDQVDLVTVAQALHWLDAERFADGVLRVSVPGGVVAVWCYLLFRVEPSIDRIIDALYAQTVGPYWPPERKLLEQGYRTVPFPFEPIPAPELAMTAIWSLEQLAGFLGTWSAVRRFSRAEGRDPVPDVIRRLEPLWPAGAAEIRWPLAIRAGRVDRSGRR